MTTSNKHWNAIFSAKTDSELGWHESDTSQTFKFLDLIPQNETTTVFLPGAGTSVLVDELLARGHQLILNEISDEALDKLKKGNKTFVEKQLIETIDDELDKFDLKEIKYAIGDLIDLMNKNNLRVSGFQMTNLLKEKWNMQSKNTSYQKYYLVHNPTDNNNLTPSSNKDKGRVYTFSKEVWPLLAQGGRQFY